MKHIFIIEHLEPQLWPWCVIEYKNMSKTVGKDNIWFTNIQKEDIPKLKKYGSVFTESVKSMKLDKICILDPEAPKTLSPEDQELQYFVFGGILGDNPPRKRTGPELTQFLPNAEKRDIGKEQFSTDNAVFAVDQIINKGKRFEDLKFQEGIEIQKNKVESFILPYRYNIVKGKPFISKELVSFLKKKDGF